MDIVLDDSKADPSIKEPRNAKTKRVDKITKEFIETLFRLL